MLASPNYLFFAAVDLPFLFWRQTEHCLAMGLVQTKLILTEININNDDNFIG